jgi:hypothetical protein
MTFKTCEWFVIMFIWWNDDESEGEKNTRRVVELCFEKFFVSLKTEHTDQKLSETASEVIIRI